MITPSSYRRHSRFSHAVNFVNGNALIAVVDSSVGAGPVNIVADDLANWEFGDMEIVTSCIHAGGQDISLRDVPRYDSTLRAPDNTDPARFKANLVTLRDHLINIAPDESLSFLLSALPEKIVLRSFENVLRSKLVEAVDLLRQGQLHKGVAQLKGLGRGLTPQGDDFVAGLLFALHLREWLFGESVKQVIADIQTAAQSNNPFSRAMLDCAAQGRAFERLKNLVVSLFGTDAGLIEAGTRELTAIGASSGADIAVGLLFGLEQH